jgi:hypothetical protein
VKLDVDALPTVPAAPPVAGPDRALAPPPPPAGPRPGPGRRGDADGDVAVADGDVVVAEGDVAAEGAEAVADGDEAQPAESPITAHVSAAAVIPRLFRFDSNRCTPGRRACLAMSKAEESGEDAGGVGCAAPAPPGLPATGGLDVALETGRAGMVP